MKTTLLAISVMLCASCRQENRGIVVENVVVATNQTASFHSGDFYFDLGDSNSAWMEVTGWNSDDLSKVSIRLYREPIVTALSNGVWELKFREDRYEDR